MTTKKLFNLVIIGMMMLVSGCDFLHGEKKLDFKTVYVGFKWARHWSRFLLSHGENLRLH